MLPELLRDAHGHAIEGNVAWSKIVAADTRLYGPGSESNR